MLQRIVDCLHSPPAFVKGVVQTTGRGGSSLNNTSL